MAHPLSDKERDQRLQHIIERLPMLVDATSVPGLCAAFLEPGTPARMLPFGIRSQENRQTVVKDTVFEAASLNKPVFAYAVLRSVEAGKIELDKPLADYVKKPYGEGEGVRKIMARHVLSHTTGWPNWREKDKPLELQAEPGTRFGYSGEGFVYLSQVMETVLGAPMHQFMQRLVFDPLGMGDSSYVWRDIYEKRAAQGHNSVGQPRPKGTPDKPNAAWSLHTTTADFARLLAAYLGDAPPAAALPRELLLAVRTPQARVNRSLDWGLGWGLSGEGDALTLWHWGDNGHFKCFTAALPATGTGVVVFTNGSCGLRICREIVNDYLHRDHPAFYWHMLSL